MRCIERGNGMPFVALVVAGVVLLPLVMLITRVRAEVVVLFALALVASLAFQRLSMALAVNLGGWLLTILSFLPGFGPGRWLRRKPRKVV
jgi:hypothetical protein